MRLRLWIAIGLFLCATAVLAQDHRSASIAFVDGKRVVVANASGTILRAVPLRFHHPVSQVAVSADGTQLIVTLKTFGRGVMGGDFFLWTESTKKWRRLTHGPYIYKRLEKGHKEVYDGPVFNPSGTTIAFAIHTESLYDDNDVVGAAGPLALMDLKSGRIRAIESTLGDPQKDPAGPPWYANSPQWSEDGKRLLLNFEAGFGTVDLGTDRLKTYDPETVDEANTFAVNWLSADSVLFLSFPKNETELPVPHSMNLSDTAVSSAPARFSSLHGKLLAFNSEVTVVEFSGECEVHGTSVWKLPTAGPFGLSPR